MNVLIVDDQSSQRIMYRTLLRDISSDIHVADFSDPLEALSWAQSSTTDLLLLDYRMPKMDGLEFARRFREPLAHRDVPIMLVTVVGDEPIRHAALDAGVIDFLVKPVRPRELRARLKNLLELRRHQETLKTRAFSLERRLLSSMNEIEQREREILDRLARAIEHRDNGSGMHLERIARYSGLIADALGLPDEETRLIEAAAPLHDVGKIAIPDAILLKPGRLSAEEFEVMKQHPRLGYEILKDSSSRFIQYGATIALGHHERWNGGGYPDGLSGEAIPLPARVVAVADVLDALTTELAYKPAWTMDDALAYIEQQAGQHFDPEAVGRLIAKKEQAREIFHYFRPGRENGQNGD
ncbi:MAG TPA: two-component system response regulator [Xanthomonadales bacterium]|nr:two-component system response regulator [Xanthomonadales bacterium]